MAYIWTPEAFAGWRWFHAVAPERAWQGAWHYGPTAPGTTWPAGRARCGYAQPDVAVGRHETARSVGTDAANVCTICLASLRADYEAVRRR